jgi:hypothetical protein
MNRLEKWIFNSIDLQNPMKKHKQLYNSGYIPHKIIGYYWCHFITKNGYNWEEYLKPDKHGYIISKYGQIFHIDYDKSMDTFAIGHTYRAVI